MSELTEIVRELVTATCRDGVSGFCCTECGAQIYGYGIGREKIPHQEGCFIPRIESALAAHEAEVARIGHERDTWREAFCADWGEPSELTVPLRHVAHILDDKRLAAAYEAVADLLESQATK